MESLEIGIPIDFMRFMQEMESIIEQTETTLFLFADFHLSSRSKLVMKRKNDRFELFFSRPATLRRFQQDIVNYRFLFQVRVIDSGNILVYGKVMLKMYSLLAIAFISTIWGAFLVADLWRGRILWSVISIVALIYLVISLFKEQKRFRTKIIDIFNNMIVYE